MQTYAPGTRVFITKATPYHINKFIHTRVFFPTHLVGCIFAIMYNDPCAAREATSEAFHLNDDDVRGMASFFPPGIVLQRGKVALVAVCFFL